MIGLLGIIPYIITILLLTFVVGPIILGFSGSAVAALIGALITGIGTLIIMIVSAIGSAVLGETATVLKDNREALAQKTADSIESARDNTSKIAQVIAKTAADAGTIADATVHIPIDLVTKGSDAAKQQFDIITTTIASAGDIKNAN